MGHNSSLQRFRFFTWELDINIFFKLNFYLNNLCNHIHNFVCLSSCIYMFLNNLRIDSFVLYLILYILFISNLIWIIIIHLFYFPVLFLCILVFVIIKWVWFSILSCINYGILTLLLCIFILFLLFFLSSLHEFSIPVFMFILCLLMWISWCRSFLCCKAAFPVWKMLNKWVYYDY